LKFRVSDDVEAPIDWVWEGFTDFAAIEADIRARDAELSRVGDWKEAALGVAWRGSVPVRGKVRTIEARIAGFVPEEHLRSKAGSAAWLHYEVVFAPPVGRGHAGFGDAGAQGLHPVGAAPAADVEDRAAQGDSAAGGRGRAAGAGGRGRLARAGRA
jgi:hypothetical protein